MIYTGTTLGLTVLLLLVAWCGDSLVPFMGATDKDEDEG